MKLLVLYCVLALSLCAQSRPYRSHYSHSRCASCERDSGGRIHRSSTARYAFKQQQPCPATGSGKGACPGYVIDHIKPLACGGADDPSNMQWQTRTAAKAKDTWELDGCEK